MAISFSCPCGKQSDLPESFLGKRVRCNFCGALSIVALQEPEAEPHADLDWETHVAESLLVGPAALAGGPSGVAVLEAETIAEPPHVFDEVKSSSGEVAAFAPPAPETRETTAPLPEVENPKQYKILTQRDKWFGGKFDAERLEAAINFLARQGWVVRSMTAGAIGGFGKDREELVVLLEKD